MNFYTLQDAVTELSPRINGGTCRFETAAARINQATRRIMNRPKKPIHVERVVRFFTRKDAITLPREVEKILHYTMDGAPAPLFGRAYEFVSGGWGEVACHHPCMSGKYLVDMGNHYSTMFDLPCMEAADAAVAAAAAETPGAGIVTGSGIETVADLAARVRDESVANSAAAAAVESSQEPLFASFRLVAFSTSEADVGKYLTLYGRDAMNQSLGSPLPGMALPIHAWAGGVEGEIVMDMASYPDPNFVLSDPVRDVVGVAKPATSGFVSIYSYDETTHQMYFLSKYHPQETNPRYRRYRITSPDYVNGSSIYALCELGFVPLLHADDVLIVQNMDALKLMVMAIELENERDFQAAKAYEADAYRLINEQRTAERTHEPNLIQVSGCYGFGDIRAL